MKNRAEDPDLRIAERSWGSLVEGMGAEEEEGREKCIDHRAEKVEDGKFFVLWLQNSKMGSYSFFETEIDEPHL